MWSYEAKMRTELAEQGKSPKEIEKAIGQFNYETDKANDEYVGFQLGL